MNDWNVFVMFQRVRAHSKLHAYSASLGFTLRDYWHFMWQFQQLDMCDYTSQTCHTVWVRVSFPMHLCWPMHVLDTLHHIFFIMHVHDCCCACLSVIAEPVFFRLSTWRWSCTIRVLYQPGRHTRHELVGWEGRYADTAVDMSHCYLSFYGCIIICQQWLISCFHLPSAARNASSWPL